MTSPSAAPGPRSASASATGRTADSCVTPSAGLAVLAGQTERTVRLAWTLAPMPTLWTRLLSDHVADAAGRCCACTKGGTGLPGANWPCTIRAVADLARRLYVSRGR
jgi:hypothetical protein